MKYWERYANWTVKALLVVLLLVGLVFPEAPQFQGKGWPARVGFYPISAVLIPIMWLLAKPARPYPHLADTFLVMPFLLDIAGNVANLFNTVDAVDDILHFLNWIFLAAALVLVLAPLGLARWNRIVMGAGAGALAIIFWEAVEYFIAESGATALQLTYRDTIGDLVLSSAGGAVGAIVVTLLRVGEPS